MAQKLYPSAHILEMFMPYLHDEKRLIEVLKEIVGKNFYRNVELPSFPTKEHRDTVRSILKDNDLTAITFVAPFLNEQKMSLCDLDDRRREEVLDFLKMHADFAAATATRHNPDAAMQLHSKIKQNIRPFLDGKLV